MVDMWQVKSTRDANGIRAEVGFLGLHISSSSKYLVRQVHASVVSFCLWISQRWLDL